MTKAFAVLSWMEKQFGLRCNARLQFALSNSCSVSELIDNSKHEERPQIMDDKNSSAPMELKPGDIEYELGHPIPGAILERELWSQTAIKKLPRGDTLKLTEVFGRAAPVALDIGCGNGRFAISSAVRRPDWDHVAIDILPAVIRYGTRRGNQRGLTNVRFAACDGWRFLSELTDPGTLSEVHIYHPQPYADPNKASRRMLTPDFLLLLDSCLVEGGKVFLQTDRAPYWDYIRTVFSALFDWTEINAPWPDDPHGRSRREMIARDQGLPIFRGIATRKSDVSSEEMLAIASELPEPEFKIDRPARPQSHRRTRRSGRRR